MKMRENSNNNNNRGRALLALEPIPYAFEQMKLNIGDQCLRNIEKIRFASSQQRQEQQEINSGGEDEDDENREKDGNNDETVSSRKSRRSTKKKEKMIINNKNAMLLLQEKEQQDSFLSPYLTTPAPTTSTPAPTTLSGRKKRVKKSVPFVLPQLSIEDQELQNLVVQAVQEISSKILRMGSTGHDLTVESKKTKLKQENYLKSKILELKKLKEQRESASIGALVEKEQEEKKSKLLLNNNNNDNKKDSDSLQSNNDNDNKKTSSLLSSSSASLTSKKISSSSSSTKQKSIMMDNNATTKQRIAAAVTQAKKWKSDATNYYQNNIFLPYLISINGAFAPTESTLPLYLSRLSACSSLQPLNNEYSKNVMPVSQEKDTKMMRRVDAFCQENTTEKKKLLNVPTFPLRTLIHAIPERIRISVVAIDAQGFDWHVIQSLLPHAYKRVEYLVSECQMLPKGHASFITKGSISCSEMVSCLKKYFVGFDFVRCRENNGRSREYNCLWKNSELLSLHKNNKNKKKTSSSTDNDDNVVSDEASDSSSLPDSVIAAIGSPNKGEPVDTDKIEFPQECTTIL